MSEKYLGETFDIHGGGMDLQFPHHECELAQNVASRGTSGVKYWMHNNLITINGKKMGKSLGNFITLNELFSGSHPLLEQAYTPMTIRFFILQAHYRSTIDFSNEALKAAEKGLKRIMQAAKDIKGLTYKGDSENEELKQLMESVMEALCDDMNTPIALAHMFDAVRIVNTAKEGKLTLSLKDKEILDEMFGRIVLDVMGLVDESASSSDQNLISGLVEMVLEVRKEAKAKKDWATSDLIRDRLKEIGVNIKDTKEGTEWSL